MFSDRALTELETRRQQLIAAAENHRNRLRRDVATLAHALGWLDAAADWLQRARPLLWVAAPAAGYLLARRARTVLRLLPLVLPWWRVARSFGRRFKAHETGTS